MTCRSRVRLQHRPVSREADLSSAKSIAASVAATPSTPLPTESTCFTSATDRGPGGLPVCADLDGYPHPCRRHRRPPRPRPARPRPRRSRRPSGATPTVTTATSPTATPAPADVNVDVDASPPTQTSSPRASRSPSAIPRPRAPSHRAAPSMRAMTSDGSDDVGRRQRHAHVDVCSRRPNGCYSTSTVTCIFHQLAGQTARRDRVPRQSVIRTISSTSGSPSVASPNAGRAWDYGCGEPTTSPAIDPTLEAIVLRSDVDVRDRRISEDALARRRQVRPRDDVPVS